MSIIKALFNGFRFTYKDSKTISFVYIITLLFSLIIALPFYSSIKSIAGSSMLYETLMNGFDFTVLREFLSNKGSVIISTLFSQFFWMSIFYFGFFIFFAGGIIRQLMLETGRFKVNNFLYGSLVFFFRFLRLAIIILFLHLITAAAIYAVVAIIINLMDSGSEQIKLYIIISGVSLHFLMFILIAMIADNAKFILAMDDSRKAFKAFLSAIRFCFKKFFSLFPLYIVITLLFVLIAYFYIQVSSLISHSAIVTLLLLFIIQQIFIWFRIAFKYWFLASHYQYYKTRHVTGIPIEEQKAQELEKTKQEIKVELPGENEEPLME